MKTSLSLLLISAAGALQAHEGHGGADMGHLHASDLVGLALALAVGAFAWSRRKP